MHDLRRLTSQPMMPVQTRVPSAPRPLQPATLMSPTFRMRALAFALLVLLAPAKLRAQADASALPSVDALTTMLDSRDPQVRAQAVSALGTLDVSLLPQATR